MSSRYDNRKVVRNDNELYKDLFAKRGIRFINQYKTGKLSFPTKAEMAGLKVVDHTWKAGDKYFKLAAEHYGDATSWWIIAWFNHKPTEAHVRVGQILSIPLPLDGILPILMKRKM